MRGGYFPIQPYRRTYNYYNYGPGAYPQIPPQYYGGPQGAQPLPAPQYTPPSGGYGPTLRNPEMPRGGGNPTPYGQPPGPAGPGRYQEPPRTGPASDPRSKIPVLIAAAKANGIDPNIMIRVAQSEGLVTGYNLTGQGHVADGGRSGGAMQLFVSGRPHGALGDIFMEETGLDPRDPRNEDATIWWAANRVRHDGWGNGRIDGPGWHGAAAQGISGFTGVGNLPPETAANGGQAYPPGWTRRRDNGQWVAPPTAAGGPGAQPPPGSPGAPPAPPPYAQQPAPNLVTGGSLPGIPAGQPATGSGGPGAAQPGQPNLVPGGGASLTGAGGPGALPAPAPDLHPSVTLNQGQPPTQAQASALPTPTPTLSPDHVDAPWRYPWPMVSIPGPEAGQPHDTTPAPAPQTPGSQYPATAGPGDADRMRQQMPPSSGSGEGRAYPATAAPGDAERMRQQSAPQPATDRSDLRFSPNPNQIHQNPDGTLYVVNEDYTKSPLPPSYRLDANGQLYDLNDGTPPGANPNQATPQPPSDFMPPMLPPLTGAAGYPSAGPEENTRPLAVGSGPNPAPIARQQQPAPTLPQHYISTPLPQQQPQSPAALQQGAAGGGWRAIGDSIAQGYQVHGGAGGSRSQRPVDPGNSTVDAAGGRSPQTILAYLESLPDGALRGQNIIFSTGVSNNPGQIGLVPQQLQELRRLGATNVKVVGVGSQAGVEGGQRFDLGQYNSQIQQDAQAAGYGWGGALPAVVHPATSYYAQSMHGFGQPQQAPTAAGGPQQQPAPQPPVPQQAAQLVSPTPTMPSSYITPPTTPQALPTPQGDQASQLVTPPQGPAGNYQPVPPDSAHWFRYSEDLSPPTDQTAGNGQQSASP